MAASKPTSWLSMKFHLLKCTEYIFRDLILRSGLFPFWPTELRPRSLTATLLISGIRSLTSLAPVKAIQDLISALPPMGTHNANPKAISERTSYYQVRLAFHCYPHVIRWNWTTTRFGPPLRFRGGSPCTWIDHLVSGPIHTTYISRYSHSVSL